MEVDIQNILELPKDALTLIAGHLDLFSLNGFARTCKAFSSILHYEAFWEMYYHRQPWTIFATKKEKIPTRKPNSTWQSTFIDFKNLVFDKFSVPLRGFNWAINEGILPPKKDIWIQFLIANRGLLLDDQKIAEILFRSIKSKEAFAKIFFEKVNIDLPLDWLLRKTALLVHPVPNSKPDLAFDALAYEYTIRILKVTEPDQVKTYCDNIRSALGLFYSTLMGAPNKKPTKESFDEKMSQYLTCPELQRGSDKFYENLSISLSHTRRTKYVGQMTWRNDQIVYCKIESGSLTVYQDEHQETVIATFDFSKTESLAAFQLDLQRTPESETVKFGYEGELWIVQSPKGNTTANDYYYTLYYNIVLPKLLPW